MKKRGQNINKVIGKRSVNKEGIRRNLNVYKDRDDNWNERKKRGEITRK